MYVCMYVCMLVHLYVCVHACVYVRVCAHTYVCVCTCACVYVCMCGCVGVCTDALTWHVWFYSSIIVSNMLRLWYINNYSDQTSEFKCCLAMLILSVHAL